MNDPKTNQPEKPTAAPETAQRGRFRLWLSRFSAAHFLIVLVLVLVIAPFVEVIRFGKFVETVLLTLMLLSAVPAVGGGRRNLTWAIVLVIPALVARWTHYTWSERVFPEAGLVPILLFIMFVVLNLLRYILRAPRVNSEVLCAGIATYLLLGLLWAFAYILVARLAPGSFVFTAGPASSQSMVGFTGLYFSFITLSTVGYGDIIPVLPAARLLAMVEAMTGTIYMAVLISRLVALYSSAQESREGESPNEKERPQ